MSYYPRIRDLREDNDKTQRDISEEFKMSRTQYRRYELGDREIPATFAVMLADYYNVSTDYLLGRTNDPTPPKK